MPTHSVPTHLGLFRDRHEFAIWLTAPAATYLAFRLFARLLYIRPPKPIYRSPSKSLQVLQGQSQEELPYPPDALPGARDVNTPYGSIRVYEWGPEDGRKVLFVHGISTPCIAFASMAKLLVERGCRVMLFDLFGRGYSDAPDPRVYRQGTQLFTSQIMLVLSSSPLAWTGPGRFTMVGYSLGGGVGAAFTSYFPRLVESLVLIAPSGLLRPHHISWSSKLLYGGLLPQFLVNWTVSRRLGGGGSTAVRKTAPLATGNPEATPINAAAAEVPGHPAMAKDSQAPISPDRPNVSVARAVGWQVDTHAGFIPAFISSIQHAPITNQHELWAVVGRRQSAVRGSSDDRTSTEALKEGKVLILLGASDAVIKAEEVEEDASRVLGKHNVRCEILPGGHDLPIVNAEGCVGKMIDHWGPARE